MASLFNQQTPTGILVAQAVGITASAYLLGQNATLSFVAMPAVMQAPAPLAAKQWRTIFNIGQRVGPPLAILSALATGYLAYSQDPSSTAFKLNLAATLLLPSIVPFTLIFIAPTNKALFEKQEQLEYASLTDKNVEMWVKEGETTHALIDKWGVLNLVRAAIIGLGSFCTIIAALDKREVFKNGGVRVVSGANRLE